MDTIQHLIKSYINAYFSTLTSRQYRPLERQWKQHKYDLLDKIRQQDQASVLRNMAVLMIYYGTQIQAHEICKLNVDDVIFQSDGKIQIKIQRAKTDRYILIDEETREIVKEYLDQIDFSQVHLFVDDQQQAFTPQTLFNLSLKYPNDSLVSELSGFFPIYQQSDYEIIPTPLRLNVVSRYSGKGITIAFLDSGFYPHPDLTMPDNRVLAYVNIPDPDCEMDFEKPSDNSWHGMQTSLSAAGNGYLSNGLYKGIAYNSNVILLQASDRKGRIKTEYMIKGLKWVLENHETYNIRIVNISLGESHEKSYLDNALDQMAEALVQAGIVVVVAVGNDGHSKTANRITPPSSAPSVITVGGFDDKNQLSRHYYGMYHSSYGPTIDGLMKPELIAPGIWVAAPILPDTQFYRQAELLSKANKLEAEAAVALLRDSFEDLPFESKDLDGDPRLVKGMIKDWLEQQKIVGMHYQHVDGTSFSAPIVCSIIAQMLEANPELSPRRVKQILCSTTDKIFDIPIEKQGYGLIHPRKCVKEAENDHYRRRLKRFDSPYVKRRQVTFYYHDPSGEATSVAVAGDFTDWQSDRLLMSKIPDTQTWTLAYEFPFKGVYSYKFVINDQDWIPDPESDNLDPDGMGGLNTRLGLYLD